MTDPRLQTLVEQIQRLTAGDLSYRGLPSRVSDEIDAVIVGLNYLAEELEVGGTMSDRARRIERDVVELFERAPVMLCSIDLDSGAIRRANSSFVERHGPSSSDVIGSPLRSFVEGESAAAYDDVVGRLCTSKSIDNVELRWTGHDAAVYTGLFAATCFEGDPGHSARAHCIVVDIEERRQLELQLRHAQKMDAFGRLAGAVAHDFNNVLTVMQSQLELILLDLGEEHPSAADVRDALSAGTQATSLANQLLSFAREQVVNPVTIDLNATLDANRRMVERALGESIELRMELGADLWNVHIDPGQIDQILLNLAVNARDAMPEGGSLQITTRNIPQSEMVQGLDAGAGEYVRIEVQDDGTGIAADVLPRIFEPFFSTKAPGSGTGLGLSTCYGIAKQAGGTIRVDTELGRGTRFDVYLPRASDVASPKRAARPATTSPGGNEAILVLEDNDMVRRVIVRILREAGYRTEETSRGEQALEMFRAAPDGFAMLLSDVMVPGMNGPQVAREIRELAPSLPILLVSGYADEVLQDTGGLEDGVRFMQKPFRPAELLRKVREVLDQD